MGCARSDENSVPTQSPTEGVKVAEISTPNAGMTVCPRCQARWSGFKTAHCTSCHETFTTVSAFDKHRAGQHDNDTRHCLNPATVGLVPARRTYPCWGHPGLPPSRTKSNPPA